MIFKTYENTRQSLSDHCTDLLFEKGIELKKQSFDSKFNDRAVSFLKSIVSGLLSKTASNISSPLLSKFSAVFIQDATRFGLPSNLEESYPGFMGVGGVSGGQIQLVYDLKNGEIIQTDLVAATISEAKSATGCNWIREGSLVLRDLGYFNLEGFKEIHQKKAYFISRVKPKTILYDNSQLSPAKIDINQIVDQMKAKQISSLAIEVLVGAQEKFPTKAIFTLLPQQVAEQRLRKAYYNAKTRNWNVTKEFIAWSNVNVFITNIPDQLIVNEHIANIYRLRWQIELMFKCWKSHYKLHLFRNMKKQRIECYILASLICFLCQYKIFQLVRHIHFKSNIGDISMMKFIKVLNQLSALFKQVFDTAKQHLNHLMMRLLTIGKRFTLEEKNGKIGQKTILNYS